MPRAHWVLEVAYPHDTKVLSYRRWERWKPYPKEMTFPQALYAIILYRSIIGTVAPMRIKNLRTRESYEDFPRTLRYDQS